MEPDGIKKETIDVNETVAEEFLETHLCFQKFPYVKSETRTFKIESNDGNIDKAFDNDVKELCAIKKETNDIKEVAVKELNYGHGSPFKSEFIEQEEIHIKDEEDTEERLMREKIPKPKKKPVMHQCPDCSYSTNRKDNLKTHLIMHKKGDEIDWYCCHKCPFRTRRKINLRHHVEIHNSNNLILKCSNCSYETSRSINFKRHQIRHKTNIQWLNCPECSFKTHQPSRIQIHILSHKSDAFKCSKCSFRSRTKWQLNRHQVKHESMDKCHFCPLCSYKSYARNIFKAHCRRLHGIDPNNPEQTEIYKCTECSYESGCKRTLETHQLIHVENRWLQCQKCAYKTTLFSNLRCHLMTHKCSDEIQWFGCSQCSFQTAYKNNLRQHRLKHKGEQKIEWFFCYECSFKTKWKRSLPKHMSTHKKTN